jgi:phosphoribosylamine--glycine ligase
LSRFLLLSEDGSCLGLALRLQAEGHSVKMWIRDPRYKDVGKGLVDCDCSYEFGQIIVPECVGFGVLCDVWRDSGIRVFAGSSFADSLEGDRELSEGVMHDCGIETPKSGRATTWEEAAKLVQRFSKQSADGKVVIKPEGRLSGIIPSYVAASVEDAIGMLENFEKETGSTEPELVIQQFVKGVAVSTEGWFDGENWLESMFNHTLETKKTLNDDLGPSEGCAGNIVWSCDSDDPIVKQSLLKLTDTLREARYVGPFDINCVVNEEGLYALEFTPRFGYDAFPTLLCSLCDFDFGSFIDLSCHGQSGNQHLGEGFGAGVRLTVPLDEDHQGTTQVRGFSPEELQWFYPYHLGFTEQNGLESIKKGNMLGVVTGLGETIGEAFARAYLLCSKTQIRDVQFRSDLAETCLSDYVKLREYLFEEEPGWIGVDLDGTLAKYSGWSDEVGEPIPKMIARVRSWIAQGHDVRILTARGSQDPGKYEQLVKVHDWVKKHIGVGLEVTHKKNPEMIRLYDDRVRQVRPNTGELVTEGSRSSVGI